MGPAPNVQVASVTTLAAGSNATVSRHEGSTDSNPTFDFGIPRGTTFTPIVSSEGVLSWENDGGAENPEGKSIKGPKGDTGETGATGATGPTGPMGGFQLIGRAAHGTYNPGTDYAIITSNIPGTTPYQGEVVLISALDSAQPPNNVEIGDLWTIYSINPQTISGGTAYSLNQKIGNIRGPQGVAPNIGGDGYWYISGVKQDYPARGVDGNPVGTILAFMGTSAPSGYLICDGSTVAYSSYTALGNFFNTQFGSRNYFGGTTTNFMLPDLRNLFLRGYHGAAEALSGQTGVLQNATRLPNLGINAQSMVMNYQGSMTYNAVNIDLHYDKVEYSSTGAIRVAELTLNSDNATRPTIISSRPINTAVLYCIKYV